MGLSSDKITIDYSIGVETVYNDVLKLVCATQLDTRAAKETFARVLSAALGLSNTGDGLLSVEDIMYRPPKQPEEITVVSSIRYAQPLASADVLGVADPELEVSIARMATRRYSDPPVNLEYNARSRPDVAAIDRWLQLWNGFSRSNSRA
jgi:hypothetical protein